MLIKGVLFQLGYQASQLQLFEKICTCWDAVMTSSSIRVVQSPNSVSSWSLNKQTQNERLYSAAGEKLNDKKKVLTNSLRQ